MGGATSTATPIPMTPGEAPERIEAPERTSTVKGNGRILVVDDEQSTCELIAASLEKHGFEVDWLTRATDALEAVKQVTGQFGGTHGINADPASAWRFFNTLYSQLGSDRILDLSTRRRRHFHGHRGNHTIAKAHHRELRFLRQQETPLQDLLKYGRREDVLWPMTRRDRQWCE